MAKTLYEFKADLKDLQKLNSGLTEAKTRLDALKKGTQEYNAQLKKVGASSAQLNAQTGNLKKTTDGVKALNTQGNRMVAIFKSASIAIASAFVFRAIIGSITGVIKSFSDFESRMAAVKAISGATNDEFKELSKSALELGSTTVFTATQVATLQEEFARLGFTTKEILAAQAATLDLAAATGEDLASAAAIAGSSLRAFGLNAEQIVRVTNTMGAAFTNSALNLERFTQSMKFVAPVGKAAGFTIEETTSLLMNLADAGLHGSIAGNGLKNIFIKLGDANSKLRKEIGHSVQGLPQMIEVLRGMKEESFSLTDAVELLDKRSAPAFLALLENIDGLEANLDTLNGAEGVISEMASIRLDTLEGDFTLLKSAAEGLAVSVGGEFNLAMREAVYNFTLFVQGLQEGSGFVDKLKLALKILRGVLIGVVAKFLILKATMAPGMFIGAVRGVRLMAISLRGLATGAYTASTAMKGLRAAISSTGIGVLVVGLGMLVDWLVFASEEVGELQMKTDRLITSFRKEITAVTELTEGSKERHDALRKLNTAYPELLENVDLEILSNRELLEVLKLINETEGLRLAIAANKDEISGIDKEMYEDIAEINQLIIEEQLDLERQLEDYEGNEKVQNNLRVNIGRRIKAYEDIIEKIKDAADEEKKSLLETHDIYTDMLDEKVDANSVMNKANTEGDETYRLSLRSQYKDDLEEFRKMKYKKQLIRKQEVEDELNLMKEKIKIWEEEVETRSFLDFKGNAWGEIMRRMEADDEAAGLQIKISEFEKYFTDLQAILDKFGGGGGTKKALQGFKLENTKNQLKKLFDLQNKFIIGHENREMDAAEKSFEFKKEKYKKEEDLMKKNLESIEQISNQSSDKQIRADIKKNKSKYDVLKNMDMEEWNNLMDRKKTNHDDLMLILDKMYAEETKKLETNGEIQLLIIEENEQDKLEIIRKYQQIRREASIDIKKSELSMEDDSVINFYKKHELKKRLLKKEYDNEVILIKQKYKDKKEQNAALKVLDKQNEVDKAALKSEKIQEEIQMYKDMYSQIFDAASSVWNNIQAMKMKSLEETHSRELEEMQGKQDRELELHEGNAEAQANINKTYEDRKEALEDKKNEKVRHIKRQQFRLDKANSIVMALINGYQAITKVSGETGMAAIIAAPIMAGFIAAQVAAISAQKFVGAKGGIIPDDKFAEGGMVHGASHANGGVKFATGGRVVELEGGEAVINKKSTSLFQPLLSQINSHNGYGKQFAAGGITPGTNAITNKKSTGINSDELAMKIAGAVNSKQVFVVESDISGAQNSVAVSESNATIF